MLSKEILQNKFIQAINELPDELKTDLIIQFDQGKPMYGMIDVVIYKGDQCMALGKFQPIIKMENPYKNNQDFSVRFNMAMGYHTEPWYLFGFNGDALVINDMSQSTPEDSYPDNLGSGLRRLCTLPKQWHAEQQTLKDMRRYLDALYDLLNEEAINNNVN